MFSCGLILLAGGASSRLQTAKQALGYQGTNLLRHSLQQAQAAAVNPVMIVLGAYTDPSLTSRGNIQVVHNHIWKEGIASSIRCGLQALLHTAPQTAGVILMVCDQPFVTSTLLNELISTAAAGNRQLVACAYKNTFGTPVFFRKEYFDALAALQGDEGAKKIVRQHLDIAALIPFPGGEIDIDTMDDYQALLKGR